MVFGALSGAFVGSSPPDKAGRETQRRPRREVAQGAAPVTPVAALELRVLFAAPRHHVMGRRDGKAAAGRLSEAPAARAAQGAQEGGVGCRCRSQADLRTPELGWGCCGPEKSPSATRPGQTSCSAPTPPHPECLLACLHH